MNTQFAETLRRLRTEKGLSQKQLGSKLFIDQSTIARWESGARLPEASEIKVLSQIIIPRLMLNNIDRGYLHQR